MASAFTRVFYLLLLADLYSCVVVRDGAFSFSLDDVKKLKDLLPVDLSKFSPRMAAMDGSSSVCANNELPEVFGHVCKSPRSGDVFKRLAQIPIDVCEICAYAACSGC
ncbi:guanylin-like [Rhinatrema bivittatum]|uniref:guanylin-like n=1 Tax=Rhinatrema bivittatum TaxID=194408 RepID=UPI00112631F4|nr:guanylin-like [Rhinatrema bivittatum]